MKNLSRDQNEGDETVEELAQVFKTWKDMTTSSLLQLLN